MRVWGILCFGQCLFYLQPCALYQIWREEKWFRSNGKQYMYVDGAARVVVINFRVRDVFKYFSRTFVTINFDVFNLDPTRLVISRTASLARGVSSAVQRVYNIHHLPDINYIYVCVCNVYDTVRALWSTYLIFATFRLNAKSRARSAFG